MNERLKELKNLKTIEDCYDYATRYARMTRSQAFRWVNHITRMEDPKKICQNRDYSEGYCAGVFNAYGMMECREFVSKILELARNEYNNIEK